MKIEIIKCDVCKREKEASNHWFLGDVAVEGGLPDSVQILNWKEIRVDRYDHLCGRECAQKYVEKFLNGK